MWFRRLKISFPGIDRARSRIDRRGEVVQPYGDYTHRRPAPPGQVREYHVDGLRLDAVQTIHDESPRHILADIQTQVQKLARELGRNVCVIAESDEERRRQAQARIRREQRLIRKRALEQAVSERP